MLATVLFASRDTSLFYYGDEIGMKTTPPTRVEDVRDPVGRKGWPKEKGRDGDRTPMQWTPGTNAGFTTGTPWLPIPDTYKTVNVETEVADFDSLLNWYKQLIELRKANEVVRSGKNVMLNTGDTKVLAWARQIEGQADGGDCVQFHGGGAEVCLRSFGDGADQQAGEDVDEDSGERGSGDDLRGELAALWGLYRRAAVGGGFWKS